MFVIQAEKSTISQENGLFILTLSGLDYQTLIFSERPQRIAAEVQTKKLLSDWHKNFSSFNKIPPNAALIYPTMNTMFSPSLSVELMDLKPLSLGQWSWKIKDLSGKLKSGSYGKTVLFVDNFWNGPCGFANFNAAADCSTFSLNPPAA